MDECPRSSSSPSKPLTAAASNVCSLSLRNLNFALKDPRFVVPSQRHAASSGESVPRNVQAAVPLDLQSTSSRVLLVDGDLECPRSTAAGHQNGAPFSWIQVFRCSFSRSLSLFRSTAPKARSIIYLRFRDSGPLSPFHSRQASSASKKTTLE